VPFLALLPPGLGIGALLVRPWVLRRGRKGTQLGRTLSARNHAGHLNVAHEN